MKNLILEELYIEITRNCNQNCQHCMRGTKQNINISNTVLEHIFMNPEFHIVKIDKLVLTGGEPFLNPEAIIQILNLLDQQKIKINILQIVTNGSIYIHSLIKKLEYFQKKKHLHSPYIIFPSFDQFHQKIPIEIYELFRSSSIFYEGNPTRILNETQILKEGNAEHHNIGNDWQLPCNEYYLEEKNNDYYLKNKNINFTAALYISVNGNIVDQTSYSFQHIDEYKLANIITDSLFDLFPNEKKQKRRFLR